MPRGLSSVASETKRIIAAHSLHFTALSLLFLLPISLLGTAYSVLLHQNPGGAAAAAGMLAAAFSASVFSFAFEMFAVGSITDSAIQAFHGRPVKPVAAAVKSTFRSSFLRLSLTQFIVNLAVWIVSIVLSSLVGLAVNGLAIDPDSPYLIVVMAIHSVVLISIGLSIRTKWALAPAIVVVESKFGVSALKRSSHLVKAKWPAVFCFVLSNAIVVLLSDLACSAAAAELTGGGWKNILLFVAVSALTLTSRTLFFLCFFVGETFLYLYCKSARGEELASDIAPLIAKLN